MKFIIALVIGVTVLLAFQKQRTETVATAVNTMQSDLLEIQKEVLKQQELTRIENWKAQKVKIYVRAKDTKTCMKILKIDVLNNEVAECNKDRYVKLRNDEVEKFKKENEL